MKKRTVDILRTALLTLSAYAVIAGCAHDKKPIAPTPEHFVLVPLNINVKGFKTEGNAAVFENQAIGLSAETIFPDDRRLEKKAFAALNGLFFMFVELEITNKTPKPFIYKPNYTHLRTQMTDYIMPSDYTAIYDVLSKLNEEESPAPAMSEITGLYYDSDTTIPPGKSVKKLLVFERLSNDALGKETALSIDELYVGTDTAEMALPFKTILYKNK